MLFRLVGRHANYKIGTNAANKWIEHMDCALDQHVKLSEDREAKNILKKYFRFTAHYIVAGMEYMRDDQVCKSYVHFFKAHAILNTKSISFILFVVLTYSHKTFSTILHSIIINI